MSTSISGYDIQKLTHEILNHLSQFTGSAIRERLLRFIDSVPHMPQPITFSIGENCAAGTRLRQIETPRQTSSLFDNIVAPLESIISLLRSDFRDFLSLSNLTIGEWEGHDSVFDNTYQIYFHHYFLLRSHQKEDFSQGRKRRLIDETDIPLFLAVVRSQFEYLIDKFRFLLRADVPKRVILRRVNGEPTSLIETNRLEEAFRDFGARHLELCIVHSKSFVGGNPYNRSIHRLIEEDGERWGSIEAWRALF